MPMISEIALEALRKQALKQLAENEQTSRLAEEGNAVVQLDQSSTGRLSRMDAMQQQAMSGGMIERLKLQNRRLLAALDRMDQGEYGVCCQCHDELPLERLQADVAAPFCIKCQSAIDEKGKGA